MSAKLLHLYTHRSSLPPLLSLLYLPTFLLQDVILLVCSKVLIFRQDKNGFYMSRRLLAALLTFVTSILSACQISFYCETGGEIQWMAAGSLAADPAGIHLLMSGLPTFTVAFVTYCGVAWLVTPWFYDIVDSFLGGLSDAFKQVRHRPSVKRGNYQSIPDDSEVESVLSDSEFLEKTPAVSIRRAMVKLMAVVMATLTCVVLQIVRPTTPPYDHMSGSLPFVFLQSLVVSPSNAEFCLPHPSRPVDFPFSEVFSNISLEPAHENFPGWMPQSEECLKKEHDKHHRHRPHHHHHQFYDPKCDPMKITNLDQDFLAPLKDALNSQRPSIKHVVLLTLESTRKDMFPFRKDSQIYKNIASSYDNIEDIASLDSRISRLTPVSEILTGESSGFEVSQKEEKREPSWKSRFNNTFGGINVHDVMTGSDFTFKSLLGSHCGVEPLPVDFTEETKGRIYQPCIPQILDTFNKQQEDASNAKVQRTHASPESDYLSSPWESVLMQSITDQFDSQDMLDDHMGFRHVVTKETLLDPTSKYFPPKEPESNYFGFPEPEILPYLRDLFTDAERDNRRLFLSHVTSTTHHPFNTPESWKEREDYLAKQKWRPEDPLNGYLNTIKYQDEWIGTIFNLLEEVGILDQTLVVIVGDHGMAFDATDGSSSTYQNGHISNFRVPLLFLHPSIPRVQLSAKTTSLAIVPTILDLLIHTASLNTRNIETARYLIHQYQGQSLVRKFVPSKDGGRQLWYFGMINPGGSMMVVSSAATEYRLLLPLCSSSSFMFTDTGADPGEKDPIVEWTLENMVKTVRDMKGEEAAEWTMQAEKLGRWWFWEQRERWNYHKAARSTDRSAEDSQGGQIKKEHWWDT